MGEWRVARGGWGESPGHKRMVGLLRGARCVTGGTCDVDARATGRVGVVGALMGAYTRGRNASERRDASVASSGRELRELRSQL